MTDRGTGVPAGPSRSTSDLSKAGNSSRIDATSSDMPETYRHTAVGSATLRTMEWQETLERAQSEAPDPLALARAVGTFAPGSTVTATTRLRGGLGAVLWRVDIESHEVSRSLVLRGLMPEWGEGAEHLDREVGTHRRLGSAGVPVPPVLWSDPTGDSFGRPAFLMPFAPGRPLVGDLPRAGAVEAMATALRTIHTAPTIEPHVPLLESVADHVRVWDSTGRQSDVVDAGAVLTEIRRLAPTVSEPRRRWVHSDFHGGNVLWDGTRVTAVLDWTHARVGDPLFDESYAHLDTLLAWGPAVATRFRAAYGEGDHPDLRFWDLLAVARALPSPVMWLPAFVASGCADLTEDDLHRRYADHTESLLG